MKLVRFVFALLCSVFISMAFAEKPTQVVPFEVSESGPALQKGKCWTESVAAPRKGAWRCMIGNAIYDPCFSTSSKNVVICGTNPAENKTGFAVKLTEPLPGVDQSKKTLKDIRPFQVRLANGAVCQPFTGTRIPVGENEMIEYSCYHQDCAGSAVCQMGVLSIDETKPVWLAKVIKYKAENGKLKVISVDKAAVETAWK